MTKRGGAINFCIILANHPPPLPDATILIYLNDREGAPLSFVGFWRPPPNTPSPDATILHNPNERRGGAIIFVGF